MRLHFIDGEFQLKRHELIGDEMNSTTMRKYCITYELLKRMKMKPHAE